ncbi:MAG: asparagine synthase (glutamine-hydrolyzing) [Candidatus Tectomicrobia bacterium]|nr:asparagine synthase (glutamine-hydrolyzing) [Candidatus Tectomicrobia bacterium]
MMCGIAGIWNRDGSPVPESLLKRMGDTLHLRGPDDEGLYSKEGLGLVHRRLSIIDLSEAGHQPMSNEDGTVWVVFNGEIYNFMELREVLEKKGHRFRSSTDTEVILHSYEEWGIAAVERFNGMFAFALWDSKEKRLVLARDRLGKKPLFYALLPGKVIFASEVKAIIEDSEVSRKLDLEAFSDYLSLGYILCPKSILKNIRKVPPGAMLILDNEGERIVNYWDLASRFNEGCFNEDVSEMKLRLLELLQRAVEKRLVSDAPLGAFLSGGIDSSSVVALMRGARKEVSTFSIGFLEHTYNELDYAEQVARYLGTHHSSHVATFDIIDLLPHIIWCNDEPLADTSTLGMYLLSRFTTEQVKVALSGDGGDENFGGYDTYLADMIFPSLKRFFSLVHPSLIERLLPVTTNKVSWDYKVRQFLSGIRFDPEMAHFWWRTLFSDTEKEGILRDDCVESIRGYHPFLTFKRYFDEVPGDDFIRRACYVDIKTWLVDDILVKVDRMSMGNSLEVRCPFLDHEVVEFAAAIPVHWKIKLFERKIILKKIMASYLPRETVKRKKAGFNSPVSVWFKGELKGYLLDILSEERLNSIGLFNDNSINTLMKEHFHGERDHGLKLWTLLNFVLWWDRFRPTL